MPYIFLIYLLFAVQETFIIIINVENSFAAAFFCQCILKINKEIQLNKKKAAAPLFFNIDNTVIRNVSWA